MTITPTIISLVGTVTTISIIALLWQYYGVLRWQWPKSSYVKTVSDPGAGEDVLSDWFVANANGLGFRYPTHLSFWQRCKIDHMSEQVYEQWAKPPNRTREWELFLTATALSCDGDCRVHSRVILENLLALGLPRESLTFAVCFHNSEWHMIVVLDTEDGTYIFSNDLRLCTPFSQFVATDAALMLPGIDTEGRLYNGMTYAVVT